MKSENEMKKEQCKEGSSSKPRPTFAKTGFAEPCAKTPAKGHFHTQPQPTFPKTGVAKPNLTRGNVLETAKRLQSPRFYMFWAEAKPSRPTQAKATLDKCGPNPRNNEISYVQLMAKEPQIAKIAIKPAF